MPDRRPGISGEKMIRRSVEGPIHRYTYADAAVRAYADDVRSGARMAGLPTIDVVADVAGHSKYLH